MQEIAWIIPLLSAILGAVGGAGVIYMTITKSMAQYQQKVDDLKEEKDKICVKIESLRTDVDTLKEFRVNAQKFIDKSLYEAKSPLQLSKLGKQIIKESGFEDIFEKTKGDLASKLEEKSPNTKYDTQEKARALMDELINYPPFEPLKSYAYRKGRDYAQILRAGAILLRDYYFELHPDMKE